MSARLPLSEMKRPRRQLGAVLSFVLHCPLCLPGAMGIPPESRVVAYRERTVRMECRDCGLRFSVNWIDVAQTLLRRGAPGWGDKSSALGEIQGMQAFEAAVRGLGRWEQFCERLESRNNGAVDTGGGEA